MGDVKPEIVERARGLLAEALVAWAPKMPMQELCDATREALAAVAEDLDASGYARGRAAGIREAAEKLAAELPDALTEALARYKGDSAGDASGAAHHLYWVDGWDKLCAGEVRRILALLEQPAAAGADHSPDAGNMVAEPAAAATIEQKATVAATLAEQVRSAVAVVASWPPAVQAEVARFVQRFSVAQPAEAPAPAQPATPRIPPLPPREPEVPAHDPR